MPRIWRILRIVVSEVQQPDEGRLNGSQALVGRDARLGTNAGPQDQLSGVQLILGLVRGPMGLPGRLL